MATFNKFLQFTKDLIDGVHDFDGHAFKVMLVSSPVPINTNTIKGNLTEIAAGNGYTAGGLPTTMTTSTSTGTAKVTASDVQFTATPGNIGPFQYVVLYNDTPTSPADPLIGWYDYTTQLTITAGNSFTVDFDGTNGVLTIT